MSFTVKLLALGLLITGLFLSACTPASLRGSAGAAPSLPPATPSTSSSLQSTAEAAPSLSPATPSTSSSLRSTTEAPPSLPPAALSTSSSLRSTAEAAPSLPASPSPSPGCTSNLTYLADLTLPDGSTVQPGELLDKQWQVENSGTCNWQRDYRLKLVAGDEMGAAIEQALYPARAGAQAVIELAFIAPSEPGLYRSAWQAYNPQDEPFGDPIFIDIAVASP